MIEKALLLLEGVLDLDEDEEELEDELEEELDEEALEADGVGRPKPFGTR